MQVYDCWVNEICEDREESLEVGEEGRVIEGPRAGFVGVPEGEREGMGNGEPVAVNFEICASIGRYKKELYAGGDACKPGHLFQSFRDINIRYVDFGLLIH